MDDRQKLLAETETAYADLRRTLGGIPEVRMAERWLGTWGVREIAIHISGWHREMIPALERLGRGQAPYAAGVSYGDFDAWNARFVDAKRETRMGDVIADLDASHRDFLAAARALPAEQLGPGGRARELFEGTGLQHYQEHAGQIREWRRGQGI
jgi:hypothetical protein